MKVIRLCLLGLLVALGHCQPLHGSEAGQRSLEREVFRQGWDAARRGQQAGLLQAIADLPDYPLTPYLQYELLRQRIDQVPQAVMTQFLARYRDWSFRPSLERAWLRSLGKRNQFDLLLEYGEGQRDAVVRCHLARARLERGQTDGLAEQARELWLVGHSQADACDEVFDWWKKQGNPDADTAWQRFHLALGNGQEGLARYLKRYLPREERGLADDWLAVNRNPAAALRQARHWSDSAETRKTLRFGFERLAVNDWEAADKAWKILGQRFAFSDADRLAIRQRIALFRAVALDEEALPAIDDLPEQARSAQLLAWRARAAMNQGLWDEVLRSIEAMPVSEQASSRWRYWRARALAELSRPEAALAYASLSGEANYYGFLAAARLNQPLSLCEEDIAADAEIQRRLSRDAEFERVSELFHVGLAWHARRSWQHMAQRLSDSEMAQAALLASAEGWHHWAIVALMNAGRSRAYPWRFPMAAKGVVLAEAERWGVDPAIVWGLMRAESAMQPDARSPAGALGLLQLMPGTAQAVAGRNGIGYSGPSTLTSPDINVPLGVAHLGELMREYNGNWAHVAAAYNAGSGALERWLEDRPAPAADVWVESLPYYETRDYIPKVLAYATIYEWRLSRQPSLLTGQIMASARPAAGFACPP